MLESVVPRSSIIRERWFRALVVAYALSAAAPSVAQSIFEDGFESGTTCAWMSSGPDACLFYAHTTTDLYRVHRDTLEVLLVGPFNTGGPSITDIAVDKNDVMIAVSLAKIWSINKATGAATEIAAFDGSDGLTSLSFVPLNASDPGSAERLVTAGSTGNVYEVNPATGAITLLGSFGQQGGQTIRAAGDMVSVRGVGTFATVTIGDTATDSDFLATINTTTWGATPIGASSTGYDRVFGLGYASPGIVGFVDNGSGAGTGTIITIDPVSGVGSFVQTMAFRWFGAGVATDAPIAP